MIIPLDYLRYKYNIKSKNILHCGASTGQEIDSYNLSGIEQVIWIEAIPAIYDKLIENINNIVNEKKHYCDNYLTGRSASTSYFKTRKHSILSSK